MSRTLKPSEFYKAISETYFKLYNRQIDPEKVEWVYMSLLEVITTELLQYGEIKLPTFATLKLSRNGGKVMAVPVVGESKRKEVYVAEHYTVKTSMTEKFIDVLNGDAPSRAQIFDMREKARRKVESENKEKQEKIAKDRDAMFESVRQYRLDSVKKKKYEEKLSKKKKQEQKQQREKDDYGF